MARGVDKGRCNEQVSSEVKEAPKVAALEAFRRNDSLDFSLLWEFRCVLVERIVAGLPYGRIVLAGSVLLDRAFTSLAHLAVAVVES